MNLWRAPTDNDARRLAARWAAAGLDRLQERARAVSVERLVPQAVRVRLDTADLRVGVTSRYDYLVWGSGDVVLEHTVKLAGSCPHCPVSGSSWSCRGECQEFAGLGRGPDETYAD